MGPKVPRLTAKRRGRHPIPRTQDPQLCALFLYTAKPEML